MQKVLTLVLNNSIIWKFLRKVRDKVHWKVNSKSFKRPSGNTKVLPNKLIKRTSQIKLKNRLNLIWKKIYIKCSNTRDIKTKTREFDPGSG